MGLGNRAKDKMLGNLIPEPDDSSKIKVRHKNKKQKNQIEQEDIKMLQAKALIQKNWKLPVPLVARFNKYVYTKKMENPGITETSIIEEILDEYLNSRGF